MMNLIGVASRSFSKHAKLRSEILARFKNVKFNDTGESLSGDRLIDFLDGCDGAITALEVIDENLLSNLPGLKVISKYGVGLDMIDIKAMKKYNLKLGWTGGVNKRSVSELVISSSISLLHKVVFANTEVKKGKWYQVRGRQLSECTFGIVGCGFIGKDLIKLLKPFNCKIIAHDIVFFDEFYKRYNVEPKSLEDLLKLSDVITLHLPLDKSTKGIINKENIGLIKKSSILLNYARGGLIDEYALKDALINNKIAGAALDVFVNEPPSDMDFVNMENVLITPHIGGSTDEAIYKMGVSAINGLDNAVDPIHLP